MTAGLRPGVDAGIYGTDEIERQEARGRLRRSKKRPLYKKRLTESAGFTRGAEKQAPSAAPGERSPGLFMGTGLKKDHHASPAAAAGDFIWEVQQPGSAAEYSCRNRGKCRTEKCGAAIGSRWIHRFICVLSSSSSLGTSPRAPYLYPGTD